MKYYKEKKIKHKINKLYIIMLNKFKTYKFQMKLLELYLKIYIKLNLNVLIILMLDYKFLLKLLVMFNKHIIVI